MPTYEYECKNCGYSFEVFQSMSDDPLKICTKCGKEVRRLIFGGAGVIFKGSGFYVTDKAAGKTESKAKKPPTAPESAGSADSKGSADSQGSTDSKGSSDTKAPCGTAACGNAVCNARHSGDRKTKPAAQTA